MFRFDTPVWDLFVREDSTGYWLLVVQANRPPGRDDKPCVTFSRLWVQSAFKHKEINLRMKVGLLKGNLSDYWDLVMEEDAGPVKNYSVSAGGTDALRKWSGA